VLKTPEQWLEQAAPEKKSGIFKVFLGYAPGVGKTYSMLSEAIRRHKRNEDVIIGVVETHGRKGVAELIEQLPVLPRRQLEYKGTQFEEMDVDAIITRKPQVILVDELAHTNVEGSKHKKRYEDVLDILEAKIDVLSTMNIQHLESVSPTVQSITGIKIRETVPDWVLERANEVVLADLTPESRFHSEVGRELRQLRRPERNGEQWVSRRVARNGIVCVDSQHVSVGKNYGASTCDVLVTDGLFQFWVGNELLKTVARTGKGEIRKKHAERTRSRR